MSSEEFGALVFLLGYVALFGLAIKVFGIRRVFLVLFGIVLLAVAIASKSLGAVTRSRRY